MQARFKIALLLLFFTSLIQAQNSVLKEPYAYIPGVLYTQGFEGAGSPPPKWELRNTTGTQVWERRNGARTGNYAMFIQEANKVEEDLMILPKYTVKDGDSLIFYLKPYYQDTQGDYLEVLYSSSGTTFTYSLMDKVQLSTYDSQKWTRIAISLDDIAGYGYYIAFKYTAPTGNGSGVYIDDLSIGQANQKTAGTSWLAEKPLPAGRSAHGAAFYTDHNNPSANGTMFIISGAAGKNPKTDAAQSVSYKYDVYTKEWSEFAADVPGKYISAEQIKGKIYVPGGLDASNQVYEYERIYDVKKNAWTTPSYKMSTELSDYASGLYLNPADKKYYAFGITGEEQYGATSVSQYYSLSREEFGSVGNYGSTVSARQGARGGVVGNKIIVVGGIVDGKVTDEVLIGTISTGLYNYPSKITWTAAHYPGGKVTGVNAGAWNGINNQYLIFTGGDSTTTGTGLLKSTWVYDGVNSKWIEGPDRKTALSYGAVSSIVRNDSVYFAAVGGLTSAGSQTNNEWLYICNDKAAVPAGKDAAMVSIDMPEAMPSIEIVPKATFVNALADTQDIWVQLEIQPGNFKYGHWVDNVAYGQPVQTSFPKWYPTSGTYTVKMYTHILDGDELPENDTLVKIVKVSENDVAVSKIYDQPLVLVQTEISPKAQFVNISGAKKTFTVTMKVTPGDYNSAKTVEQLAAGDTVDVDFEKWTPKASGVYDVKVYTTYSGDDNKLNDTLTSLVYVSTADVKPLEFTFPAQIMATKGYAPKASFRNYAQLPQSFTVTLKATPGDYTSVKTVESLGSMNSAEVEFDVWTPDASGDYSFSVSTSLAIDDNKDNDKIDTVVSVIPFAYDKDCAITELIFPEPYLENTPITPKAKFTNVGMVYQQPSVYVKIQPGNFSTVRTIVRLDPGDTTTITFNDAWTPLSVGKYDLKAYINTPGGDEYRFNDTIKTTLYVSAPDINADIAASKINVPAGISQKNESVLSADFINNGDVTQTAKVTMKITPGGYENVQMVYKAASKDTVAVEFAPWTPSVSGSYTVKVFSSLSFDKDKTNDTITTTINIEKTDIEANALEVKKLLGVNESAVSKAAFINQGGQKVSFKATMEIKPGDFKTEAQVTNLAGYDTADVEFAAWTPTEAGVYTFKIYSSYAEDENSANDTLTAFVNVLGLKQSGEWFTEAPAPVTATVKASVSYTKKAVVKGEKDNSYIFVITFNPDTAAGKTPTYFSSVYDVNAKKWSTTAAALPGYLDNYKAVYAAGKIYVAGGNYIPAGEYASKGSDKLFIYDTETDKWLLGAPMLQASADYAIGMYGDSLIYVIGGYDKQSGYTFLNGAQIYNIKSNTWTEGTEYTGKFYPAHSGSILKNKIVVAGGVDFTTTEVFDQVVVGEIDTLNPYSITWKEKGSYPAGTAYGLTAAKYAGKNGSYIVFTGGSQEKLNEFIYCPYTLSYDPESEVWTKLSDSQIPTYFGSGNTVVRNDSVYLAVIAGYNKTSLKGLNQWLYLGEAVKDTTGSIGVGGESHSPLTYALSQNYPNPFNPTTIIRYSVAEAGKVELKVYNMLGQEVATLVNEIKNRGTYDIRFDAAGLNLSSGVYLYQIRSGSFIQTKKLILMK